MTTGSIRIRSMRGETAAILDELADFYMKIISERPAPERADLLGATTRIVNALQERIDVRQTDDSRS